MVRTAVPGLEIDREGDTLFVTPTSDLREVEHERVEAVAGDVLNRLNDPSIRNVILDFGQTDYFGSTALGFFVRLWKAIRRRNGRMVFRNVSPHEIDILQAGGLDGLWPIRSVKAG